MSTETDTRDGGAKSAGSLLTVARFEAQRRVRVTAVLAVLFGLFGAIFLWIAPDLVSTGAYDELLETLPPALTALFGFETFGSVAGVLGGEYYTFTWVVGLGGYLAYTAAGSVAGDLRTDRMDTLLAAPVSRTSVLYGKYLALLLPVLALNVVTPLLLYTESVLAGSPLPAGNLAALHALSVPYLLCWAAVGLFAGVVVRRGRTASRAALGTVVAAWLVESVVVETDIEFLGAFSPMRYFSPSTVLVDGSYDLLGAGVLLATTAVVLLASLLVFQRSDL